MGFGSAKRSWQGQEPADQQRGAPRKRANLRADSLQCVTQSWVGDMPSLAPIIDKQKGKTRRKTALEWAEARDFSALIWTELRGG